MPFLYAESSAVLSWLLGEPAGQQVQALLRDSETVFCSELTLLECHRILVRVALTPGVREAEVADLRALLAEAAGKWSRLGLVERVLLRARQPFPEEPIRSLDALHLASALVLREARPGLAMLSLDDRVRRSARALGFEIHPGD